MKKWLPRLFSFFSLLLVSCFSFADIPTITSTAVDAHTDLSIAYLAQVFGTVGDVLHGTSGQMLGQLFYKFNIGVLVVAGLWMGYTVTTIVMKSAMDGSFMGQNKNVGVIFLKIALGVGLLMPNPSTGYSVFQDIVMHVVVKGVALADDTWSYGLDYVSNGGTLWHRPETSKDGVGSVISQQQASAVLGPTANTTTPDGSPNWANLGIIQKIFLNEVCMYSSSFASQIAAQSQKNPQTGNAIYNSGGQIAQRYTVAEVDSSNSYQFPGLGNNQDNVVNGKETGYCGHVDWSSVPGADCVNNVEKDGGSHNSCQMAKNVVSEIVDSLLPAAKKQACQSTLFGRLAECTGSSSGSAVASISESFFGTLIDYANAAMPLAQAAAEKASGGNSAKDFISNAQAEGWIMAGRYYWDLAQVESNYSKAQDVSGYVPSTIVTPHGAPTGDKNIVDTLKSGANQSSFYVASALNKLSAYSGTTDKGDTGAAYSASTTAYSNSVNWVLQIILGPIFTDVIGLIANFSTHGGPFGMGPDPILFLHHVGMKCLAIAGDIWAGTALLLFAILVPAGVCQSVFNWSSAVNGVADWIKIPLMLLATMLMGVGVMLGYYVPLYPYLLFTFGVIGWLISVIEAMVAAPLVCLGLTHPEGHDFLGEAKQALILLLGVFIRPVLMIIGLIGGMILSYVSLRILVYGYSSFLLDVFSTAGPVNGSNPVGDVLASSLVANAHLLLEQNGSIGGLLMTIMAIPLFLIIFAAQVYVVTNLCFSLIYQLPDYITRWIGGSPGQSMTAQMAEQIRGAASTTGSNTGQLLDRINQHKPKPKLATTHKEDSN